MAGGRPTKYKPEMCQIAINEMADGASKCEVAGVLGVTESTIYEWVKDHKEFSEAIKEGEQLSAAWWQAKGRKNLENKDFSATLWYMNMKNRFGWKDKHDVNLDGNMNLTVVSSIPLPPNGE